MSLPSSFPPSLPHFHIFFLPPSPLPPPSLPPSSLPSFPLSPHPVYTDTQTEWLQTSLHTLQVPLPPPPSRRDKNPDPQGGRGTTIQPPPLNLKQTKGHAVSGDDQIGEGCEGCESGEGVKSVMVSGCEGCETVVVRDVRVWW